MVLSGWPSSGAHDSLQPYERRRDELSLHDGCLLWGNRVIIPEIARVKVLDELHEGHPGITWMKAIARGVVWWPGIDKDIEDKVKTCLECQTNAKSPATAPLHPWEWPEHPWTRLHIDYVGPFMGKMFLVVVDAHSKWLDIAIVSTATSFNTIQKLRVMFATHGIPQIVVSDNGSAFTSAEFKEFMTRNGIRHITSVPYHPSSNGLAERYVQTFKSAMKKDHSIDLHQQLATFLLRYRTTPHTTTGTSPAELLMGRRLTTHLDLMRPNISNRVKKAQERQKQQHDRTSKDRTFTSGDKVFVKNFREGPNWLTGTIITSTGPVSYKIQLDSGHMVRRHVDHIQIRHITNPPSTDDAMDDIIFPIPIDSSTTTPMLSAQPTTQETVSMPRRSSRVRRPPNYYGY